MKSKKELLYEVVIKHIKSKGLLKGLTISEIARKADMGKGTVYEYFNSKDELIAEALFFLLDESSDVIFNQDNKELDFKAAMCLHIKTIMYISNEYINMETFLMSGEIEGLLKHNFQIKMRSKVIDIKNKYREYLNAIMDKGIKEGCFNKVIDDYIIYIISNVIIASVAYYIQEKSYHNYNEADFLNKVYNLILNIVK
jgi:AcrR family transcriptional regulator